MKLLCVYNLKNIKFIIYKYNFKIIMTNEHVGIDIGGTLAKICFT